MNFECCTPNNCENVYLFTPSIYLSQLFDIMMVRYYIALLVLLSILLYRESYWSALF